MTTLTLSLSEQAAQWLHRQVVERQASDASSYVEELLRFDEQRAAEERLNELLLEGLNSPRVAVNEAWWAKIDQRLSARRKAEQSL